ncbi:2Fe-2S iron-sulfur cluster-binding protein [Olsenella profusa]|uniref:2Fe-2S iron-sulfur cluster-binding domain protein n=1 Tax=Olsenella profusa F0195 TaxID=1125712 RepID=U2T274_9ACTN|nr:2Fe-2S iron-sulfur cluster-binding protein [Olsenella profusa]ERL07169.1 2Fe-2S iron-sulfur cluster-binding domain protein [Olsenella profusa F0195]
MARVRLVRENRVLECAEGENLYELLSGHGLMDAPCRGRGACGKCAVTVAAQGTSLADEAGRDVLACQQEVAGDIEVLTHLVERPKGVDLQLNDVEHDPAPAGTYGCAFALGAAELLCALVDLSHGRALHVAALPDPLLAYGGGPEERLACPSEDLAHRRLLLRRLLVDALDLFVPSLTYRLHVAPGRVRVMVISADEVTLDLLLQGDSGVPGTAAELGLSHAGKARLSLLPARGGKDRLESAVRCLCLAGERLLLALHSRGDVHTGA